MKKVWCNCCEYPDRDYDHLECSVCFQRYFALWPTVGSAWWNHIAAKFCGKCGHKFVDTEEQHQKNMDESLNKSRTANGIKNEEPTDV